MHPTQVAIHGVGVKDKPTKPLMAMKLTLLVRKRPWHKTKSISPLL